MEGKDVELAPIYINYGASCAIVCECSSGLVESLVASKFACDPREANPSEDRRLRRPRERDGASVERASLLRELPMKGQIFIESGKLLARQSH